MTKKLFLLFAAVAIILSGCSKDKVVKVTGITFTQTGEVSVEAGKTTTLTITVSPADATNPSVTWSTSNASVATVVNGVVTAVSAGTAVITATANDGSGMKATISITVTPAFVAVSDITGVPNATEAGKALTLTGTVAPTGATNKTIVWSVADAGTTGATISGNTLNTTAAGTAKVKATIANGATATTPYTKEFTITVSAAFVAVTNITLANTETTEGVPLTLNGTVTPTTATNKNITWSVKSGPATISGGNTLNTSAAGTVVVTATITNGTAVGTNYTKDFNITVNAAYVPTPPVITTPAGALTSGNVNSAYSVTLAATNSPTSWAVASGSLPAGLSLNNSGVISGTPTTAGTFNFSVTARNSDGPSASRAFSIVINAAVAAPVLSNLSITDKTQTEAYFYIDMNVTATFYRAVYPGTATAKTPAEVKAHVGAVYSQTVVDCPAGGMSGAVFYLTAGTQYTLYLVAENAGGFSAVVSVTFTTLP